MTPGCTSVIIHHPALAEPLALGEVTLFRRVAMSGFLLIPDGSLGWELRWEGSPVGQLWPEAWMKADEATPRPGEEE